MYVDTVMRQALCCTKNIIKSVLKCLRKCSAVPWRPNAILRGTKNSVHTKCDLNVSIHLKCVDHLHLKVTLQVFLFWCVEVLSKLLVLPTAML